MLQVIGGREVFVVEFDTMPELPITGEGREHHYAMALTAAIRDGIVTEPGKYGVYIQTAHDRTVYGVYRITE